MEEQDLIQDEYATKDLYLAAFLQVKNMVIKKLEQYSRQGEGWNPVYFIFTNCEECDKLESIFWSGSSDEIWVNVKDYLVAIRNLKARASSVTRLARRRGASLDI